MKGVCDNSPVIASMMQPQGSLWVIETVTVSFMLLFVLCLFLGSEGCGIFVAKVFSLGVVHFAEDSVA